MLRRRGWALLLGGMIRYMARPGDLKIDPSAVRAAGELTLLCCDELSRIGRRLRVPVPAPATDPISLHLAAHANRARLHLGLVADGAAEELSRMVEFLTTGADHLAALAARTQVALLGLDVAPIAPSTPIRASRTAIDVGLADDLEPLASDAEVLSFAVLLGEGHDDWYPPTADTSGLRAGAVNVVRAGDLLATGLSYGERPAATLARFGDWICAYADTVEATEAAVGEWAAVYRAVRPVAQAAGRPFVAFLAAKMGGQRTPGPDTEAAWAVWAQYLDVRIPAGEITDFPRLDG